MLGEYQRIVGAAGLRRVPRLVWTWDTGGSIGFYSATENLIAIGDAEVARLTSEVANGYFRPVRYGGVITHDGLRLAVVRVVLAHEVGHALQYEQGERGYGIATEGGADDIAGQIAKALGWNAEIDAKIMHAIGCRTNFCDHPSPAGRVEYYNQGRRRIERRQAEQRYVAPRRDPLDAWRTLFPSLFSGARR